MVALDVDHFKTINDTFGHGAGDDVLAGIAEHLRQQTREEDVIGRLGGDEFVLILVSTDRIGAEQLAERVRAAIGTARIDIVVTALTAVSGGDPKSHPALAGMLGPGLLLLRCQVANRRR